MTTAPSLPNINESASNVRVVGSNYTTLVFGGKALAYLEMINDSGQAPMGGDGYEFIHPLGYRTPTDIVTGRVLDGGSVDLTFRELWNQNVWEQLPRLTGTTNIVEVFAALAASPQYMTMSKIITPPGNRKVYGKTYHRVVIVRVDDGDSINIGALSVPRVVRVAYTHTTPLA